jgi:hypothetical protein
MRSIIGVTLDLLVVVDAGAAGRCPPVRGDGHLLAEDQREAAGRTSAEIAHVVIVQLAVNRVVHGHRRHHGAIAQGYSL